MRTGDCKVGCAGVPIGVAGCSERVTVEPVRPHANRNIVLQYPIQQAAWITHPAWDTARDQFLVFSLDFVLPETCTFTVHISADQRFELCCDERYVGMGPDRSDLQHWSFHSYRLTLSPGAHRLAAAVHFITTHRPHAQVSLQPAFILSAEGCPVDLNTGSAAWTVSEHQGVTCTKPVFADRWYQVVGPNFEIDAARFLAAPERVAPVLVEQTNLQGGRVGFVGDGWRLYPSRLPEQLRQPIAVAGRVRMVADGVPARMDDSPAQAVKLWQELVEGLGEVTVPAGSTQTILWDLDDYVCGYPVLEAARGKGARVAIEWAEACFDDESRKTKSDRSAITGNYFEGYGDTFVAHGGDICLRSFWWRAGRYLRITVAAADEDLLIRRLAIEESRLPLSSESRFASDDPELNAIIPLTVRGIQMCAHETYMDCPYYEQMMYVGDARLQLLTTCVMSHEDRLHQRCLELLDWSRHVTDFVLMRHPSDPRQLSTTFSMVWIMMIRDLAWWRRDAAFIKGLLPGMRAQLEQFRALADERMLLTGLPGWSFIDWVNADGWEFARPPAGERGTSGICNLLFLLALQSAIDIEDAYGEPHFADNYRAWSAALAGSVQDMFWDVERGAFADDPAHHCFSEHAQCLALLSGQFGRHVEDDAFAFLMRASGLARTSVYFSFYLLEVFYRQGRGDSIIAKMDFWKELVRSGFKAPVEQPEPSRSDCHAWGSHPLFHMHASLAGIRPAAAGFAKVRVAPQPGTLRCLSCRTPHPDGFIELAMTLEAREWHVALSLPAGVPGEFVWQGVAREVTGDCTFTVPVAG